MKKHREIEITNYLSSWNTFHPIVASLDLEDVEFALKYEKANKARSSIVNRLIKRKRRIKVEEVREEISNG